MTRYTIHFTDQAQAKARYRTALKLMGAQDIRITEAQVEQAGSKPLKDNVPTTAEAQAVASLYGRSYDTPWTDQEIALFRSARKTGVFSADNMKLIATYYQQEKKKGREGIHRRDLGTFLRNASGELDRAKAYKPVVSRALEWSDSTLKLQVLPDPAEEERVRALVKQQAAKFKLG